MLRGGANPCHVLRPLSLDLSASYAAYHPLLITTAAITTSTSTATLPISTTSTVQVRPFGQAERPVAAAQREAQHARPPRAGPAPGADGSAAGPKGSRFHPA